MNLPEPKILIHQFLQSMRMRNCSERTVKSWLFVLNRFIAWCDDRSLACMSEITAEHLAAYRRSLYHYRNPKTGSPLKFDTQAHYLIPVPNKLSYCLTCQTSARRLASAIERSWKRFTRQPSAAASCWRLMFTTSITNARSQPFVEAKATKTAWFPLATERCRGFKNGRKTFVRTWSPSRQLNRCSYPKTASD